MPSISASAKKWEVGPNKAIKIPSQVASQIADGDTVDIDASVYSQDVAYWDKKNLLIRGLGGKVQLKAGGKSYGQKAIWVVAGENITIENIEFSDCKVPDKNGAGIRFEGKRLTLRNCYFHHNEMGVLTFNTKPSSIIVESCEFANNGYGDGYSHNIYVGNIDTLIFRYSYSHGAKIGHEVKSRANVNIIEYNRITNENGNASRNIDLPNGGIAYIMGNIIEQSESAENSNIFGFGLEGLKNNAPHQVYLVNNTIVNNKNRGSFIDINNEVEFIKSYNNIFAGAGSIFLRQPKTIDSAGNLRTTDIASIKFKNPNEYDYRIDEKFSLVYNKGVKLSDPLLIPQKQYSHPLSYESRCLDNAIDIGAYEYCGSSVEEIDNTNQYIKYNINGNTLRILTSEDIDDFSSVSVYNYMGEKVFERNMININTFDIDISAYPSGLYFIVLQNNIETLFDKFYK